MSASRLLARGWLGGIYQGLLTRRELPRVLIYGAGDASHKLAQALSASSELRLLGFCRRSWSA
ncbi:nucleoside-diphosphate sugar epimerase/dehydratase [Variovorax sp. DT-64]|uniref:nucleoside-diphosphate sugar epimerase/dehydratase n=1 Tax=Variovorax sp. DT-64 TaxID=3396160 RepID=UPI003F1AF4C6